MCDHPSSRRATYTEPYNDFITYLIEFCLDCYQETKRTKIPNH